MDDSANWAFPFRIPPNGAPVYILGQRYEGENATANAVNAFKSVPWFHYRSGFEPIGAGVVTSDKGWGCTIRSAQMLAASALLRANARDEKRGDIFKKFYDSKLATLSIHNIVAWAMEKGATKSYTEWFGPDLATNAIASIFQKHDDENLFFMSVRDGAVIVSEIFKIIETKPLLISVSLRWGTDSFDSRVIKPELLSLIALPQFAGIVGGESLFKSLFFIGGSADYLLYLDPHTTTRAFTEDAPHMEESPGPLRMSWSRLSPSMAIAFFVSTAEEFRSLQESLSPFVSFLEEETFEEKENEDYFVVDF